MTATIEATEIQATEPGEALVERIFEAGVGALELLTVYLGDKLGLYAGLAGKPGSTPAELAGTAGIDERYAREWLEQQALAGFVEITQDTGDGDTRRYALPADHHDVFLDPNSLDHLVPLPGFLVSFASVMPRLVDVYRTGEGIDYADFGLAMRDSQGAFNRPHFEHSLGDWIATLPDVRAKLESGETVRIADVGCGVGWSAISFAQKWPNAVVDGYDLDRASVDAAIEYAAQADVSDRVQFHAVDAATAAGEYDLVTAFECIHDMSQPVVVLETMRKLAGDDGTVLIMDEAADEVLTTNGDPVQRILATYSVLHCLPAGRTDAASVATGTLLRPSTMRRFATDAGFSDVTILPIEHDFFRFYRLDT